MWFSIFDISKNSKKPSMRAHPLDNAFSTLVIFHCLLVQIWVHCCGTAVGGVTGTTGAIFAQNLCHHGAFPFPFPLDQITTTKDPEAAQGLVETEVQNFVRWCLACQKTEASQCLPAPVVSMAITGISKWPFIWSQRDRYYGPVLKVCPGTQVHTGADGICNQTVPLRQIISKAKAHILMLLIFRVGIPVGNLTNQKTLFISWLKADSCRRHTTSEPWFTTALWRLML